MKIYEALYCPCIYESSEMTLSVHKTKRGARKVMLQHKLKERKKYQKHFKFLTKSDSSEKYAFGEHESWSISEIELLD